MTMKTLRLPWKVRRRVSCWSLSDADLNRLRPSFGFLRHDDTHGDDIGVQATHDAPALLADTAWASLETQLTAAANATASVILPL